ncbi:hypothetical protein [Amycolatopsis sp. H20-H5]|uniref:hypothetical protein n=1 Tax=Amycolatopsis sp. H20-H5 TaxID=3046309 RepID=UPI002DBFEC6B|nr:hypothetical protein [Amycolatopsis sp. H20-H5]MEC3981435.1 hypothetical protein [Amycolatopsis sp. H20-H5]
MPDELSESAALPGRVQAELTRLRAERLVFTADQDKLKAELAGTEHELRESQSATKAASARDAEHAELNEQLAALREKQEKDQETAEANSAALEADVLTARQERDSLRAELLSCREERDRLRLALLEAELVMSTGTTDLALRQGAEPAFEHQRLIEAERRAAEMARELDATRRTVSWRVTAPLRVVRKKMDRP